MHVNTASFPATTVTSTSDAGLVMVGGAVSLTKEQGKEECRTLYYNSIILIWRVDQADASFRLPCVLTSDSDSEGRRV